MTDLELTKRCADAMGIELQHCESITGKEWWCIAHTCIDYDPLHDDAQAVALVKKFNLFVNWNSPIEVWCMPMDQTKYGHLADSPNCSDLNRAIVECVAKLKAADD